jgi:hypothetical protein
LGPARRLYQPVAPVLHAVSEAADGSHFLGFSTQFTAFSPKAIRRSQEKSSKLKAF